eukprot:621026-Prymnesium_polylepis.1
MWRACGVRPCGTVTRVGERRRWSKASVAVAPTARPNLAREHATRTRPRVACRWPAKVHKAFEKAEQHSFYLGLDDYGWLELLQ